MPMQPRELATLTAALAHIAARRRAGSPSAEAEATLEARFGCSAKLAVYGTLAPFEPNHGQVADLGGSWTAATVRGRRALRDYPVFTWDEAAAAQPLLLLESALLPQAWPRLDAFEGADYCRILVPVRLAEGGLCVANLYEARRPVAIS
jgi:gamma-glutamylcyclotransferase (GGCT)/AIG2-like uncharacterized protein YtfP